MPEDNPCHKDFLERTLEIGDIVTSTSSGYVDQVLFKVISFTPKKIRLGAMIKDRSNPGTYVDEFAVKGYSSLKEGYQMCLVQKFDNSPIDNPNIRF